MYARMYVRMCACACSIHVDACMHTCLREIENEAPATKYVCMYVCMYIYMCACSCSIHLDACMHTCLREIENEATDTEMCVCVFVYV